MLTKSNYTNLLKYVWCDFLSADSPLNGYVNEVKKVYRSHNYLRR